MAEEVVTQETAAQFGQEAEDIAHTVHHGQTPQVLFSIKGSRDWKTRNSNSELGVKSREGNPFPFREWALLSYTGSLDNTLFLF